MRSISSCRHRTWQRSSMPSDTDIAWAAGFFDGEGCIMMQPRRGGLKDIVCQQALAPLEKIRSLWGGTLHTRKHHGAAGRPCTTLTLTGPRAFNFLSDVRPYLMVKGKEADLALSFMQYHRRQVESEGVEWGIQGGGIGKWRSDWARGVRNWYYHELRAQKSRNRAQ